MDHDSKKSWRLIAILLILVCGLVPTRTSTSGPFRVRASLTSNLFNRSDLERVEQGYYEQLVDFGQRLDDLADLPTLRLRGRIGNNGLVPVDAAPLVIRIDDLREVVLKRGATVEQAGAQWRTSALGVRDRWYPTKKSDGTFRIVLVGDSIAAGWGVNVEDRFESILERCWDARAKKASGQSVEIIDCAVPGHSPGQRWYHFTQIGWPMQPDMVICESSAADVGWDERRLRFLLPRGIGWDSPLYHDALTRTGVEPLGSPDDYKRALRPHHLEILAGVYCAMVDDCHAHGVPIIWFLVPRVGRKIDDHDRRALNRLAFRAGFSHLIDVTDTYDNIDPGRLAIGEGDFHPNSIGHAHLARRLDSAFSLLPEMCWLWRQAASPDHGSGSAPRQERTNSVPRGLVDSTVPSISNGDQLR
jgi:hypothetical protein